jgi:hypothetical protein
VRRITGYRGVVAATKTARSSDVRRRRRNLLLVGAAATSVPGRKRRACQYGKDREFPGSRERGRNGGVRVGNLHRTPREHGELDDGEEQGSSPPKEVRWRWSGDAVAREMEERRVRRGFYRATAGALCTRSVHRWRERAAAGDWPRWAASLQG